MPSTFPPGGPRRPPHSPLPLKWGGNRPAGWRGVRRCRGSLCRLGEEALMGGNPRSSLAIWPQEPHTHPAEEDSVGDCARIAPMWLGPPTDWVATGHTVQFGKRKSWGGRHPETGMERPGVEQGRGAWREERQDRDVESREGSQFPAWGPAPPRSQAQLRSFQGLERFGSQAPINSCEPGPFRGLGSCGQSRGERGGGWGGSCNTPQGLQRRGAERCFPHPGCAKARHL